MRRVLSLLIASSLSFGGSLACTSDLALGVDRSSDECGSDCPDSCPPAVVDACDGGVVAANCECAEEDGSQAGDEVEDEVEDETDDALDAEDPDEMEPMDQDAGNG